MVLSRWLAQFLAGGFLLFNCSCFFGTFRTADTLRPGAVDAGGYINFPVYFSKAEKDSSEENLGGAFVTPNLGGYLEYGASRNSTFGVHASTGEGIGPYGRVRFLDRGPFGLQAAIAMGITFHPVAEGIGLRGDLIFSKHLSPYSSIYFGWTTVRSPDYRKLAKDSSINDIEEFKIFHAVFLGVDLMREWSENPRVKALPLGMTLELALPITRYPALFFGFQIHR
jgi:hypothetical protein